MGSEEAGLLRKFYDEHLELPPMNMSQGAKVIAEQQH
jgi:hypothetical protein